MLKTANDIFIWVNKINIDVRGPIYPVIRIKIPLIKANSRFEAGPANAIFIMSTLGFAKYLESTGTGFAQPKPTNKIISEPKGSRWAIGFKVNLPWCFAVGSPSLYATHPCENSWKTSANRSTGINNTFIGHDAGTANGAGGVHVTENNRIILGSNAVTNFGCQVALTVHSDERDKTDITDFTKGLDIINALRPVTYRWDSRTRYGTEEDPYGTPDGSKKSDKINVGLIAQEVETVEKANGYASSDDDMLFIHKSTDGLNYGLTYEKLIPVLINAVKELSTKVTALEAG